MKVVYEYGDDSIATTEAANIHEAKHGLELWNEDNKEQIGYVPYNNLVAVKPEE